MCTCKYLYGWPSLLVGVSKQLLTFKFHMQNQACWWYLDIFSCSFETYLDIDMQKNLFCSKHAKDWEFTHIVDVGAVSCIWYGLEAIKSTFQKGEMG